MKRLNISFLLLLILNVLSLFGCATSDSFVVKNPPTDQPIRVGLLLPFSSPNKEVKNLARALSDAAQMALFDNGKTRLVLMPEDTKGSAYGAKRAFMRAEEKGAHIILGPLLSSSVRAISALAYEQEIPVIAFSSDERVVSPYIYLLGFSPKQQVRRIISHARGLGVRSIAAFLPQTAYGRLVRTSFVEAADRVGFEIHRIETYPRSVKGALAPAERVTDYAWRRKAREGAMRRLERDLALAQREERQRGPQAKRRRFVRGQSVRTARDSLPAAARVKQIKAEIKRLRKIDSLGEIPYQAILFAEGGSLLKGIVQLLPNFDITTRKVFFLGTGLWDDPSLSKELPLYRARFAAPTLDNATVLLSRLQNEYRRRFPRLATLGYEGFNLVGALAGQSDPPFEHGQITQREGFAGIDGIYRFPKDDLKRNNGAIAERGLAVIEIKRRSRQIVSKAPDAFPETSSMQQALQ